MGEGGALRSAMPVLLSRGNKDDVSRANRDLLGFRGYNPFTFGNNKGLIRGMGVQLVSHTLIKIDMDNLESFAHAFIYQWLHRNWPGEYWTLPWRLGYLADLNHFHEHLLLLWALVCFLVFQITANVAAFGQ